MSTFEVKTRRITEIEPHPNADRLELVAIGGYRSVVQKGIHTVGDLILYVPEDTVFTNLEVAKALNVDTYLTGKQKNRVKAIRLRGVVSQGLAIPAFAMIDLGIPAEDFVENVDWQQTLQLEKYEEPIPMQMAGKVRRWPEFLPKYDLENIKRPESMAALHNGEPVVVTEKLHGTNMTVAIGPGLEEDEIAFVCSRHNALKEDDVNVYWRAVRKYGLIEKLQSIRQTRLADTISLHGEVVGVQDLKYGHTGGDVGFYAFDIRINGRYVDFSQFAAMCDAHGIPTVPVVYNGLYQYEAIKILSQGNTLIPDASHIREGVVVRPLQERDDMMAGRVVFKLISDDYLTRKSTDATEYH